jgi:hypothetical protein
MEVGFMLITKIWTIDLAFNTLALSKIKLGSPTSVSVELP